MQSTKKNDFEKINNMKNASSKSTIETIKQGVIEAATGGVL